MRRVLVVFAAVALTVCGAYRAAAQPSGVFVERPGNMEFTGMMIARPLQMEAAAQKTGSMRAASALRARARQRILQDTRRYYPEVDEYIVQVPSGYDENSYARRLMKTGDYQYVEPNWRVYPVLVPNDPGYSLQWHHTRIRSAAAWDIIVGRETQIIAYTDTGIDLTHPDLSPNRVPGYNAVTELREQDGGVMQDDNGHGTHVSGIGSAVGNNGVGVTGVGWNFRIMMVVVSHEPVLGATTIDIITRGARWAADNGARTVSSSFSGVSNSAVETTGAYIMSRGGLYLYAAGNDGANLSGFDWPHVIVVGASTQSDNRASFSAYGRATDVFAPGTSIYSTYLPSRYASLDGTSMATPMANGVAAMIWAKNPTWTNEQVQQKLFESCIDLGPPGNDDQWGWGRVDLYNAVRGSIIVTPSSFAFFRGVLVSGNLQSLHNSDDNRLVARPGPVLNSTERPIQLIIEGAAPGATATSIKIVVEAHCNISNINQRIEAFNFASNSYTQVDSRTMPTSDLRLELDLPGTANNYIGSGNLLRARISYKEAGPVFSYPWFARIDEATWVVTQ